MRRRVLGGEEGQGLVEFAILLPVLVILVLGIVEGGLILYNQQVITNASREGARFGIVVRVGEERRSADEIKGVVFDYAATNLVTFGTPDLEAAVTPEETGGSLFGQDLTVDVTFSYDFLVLPNFLTGMLGTLDLAAHTTMKYE